jgi:hypothetical protein
VRGLNRWADKFFCIFLGVHEERVCAREVCAHCIYQSNEVFLTELVWLVCSLCAPLCTDSILLCTDRVLSCVLPFDTAQLCVQWHIQLSVQ